MVRVLSTGLARADGWGSTALSPENFSPKLVEGNSLGRQNACYELVICAWVIASHPMLYQVVYFDVVHVHYKINRLPTFQVHNYYVVLFCLAKLMEEPQEKLRFALRGTCMHVYL